MIEDNREIWNASRNECIKRVNGLKDRRLMSMHLRRGQTYQDVTDAEYEFGCRLLDDVEKFLGVTGERP